MRAVKNQASAATFVRTKRTRPNGRQDDINHNLLFPNAHSFDDVWDNNVTRSIGILVSGATGQFVHNSGPILGAAT